MEENLVAQPEAQAEQVKENVVDEAVKPTVENETESQETENVNEVAEQEPFLKIKYNKEDMELDREKAIEYAQKGLNYDKVYEKLQSFETDPRLAFVNKQAEANNMTVDEYLAAVEEAQKQEQINKLVEENIPEDVAKELYESRMFREQMQKQQQEMQTEKQKQEDYSKFLQQFPDVKPESIPDEVWVDVKNGSSLSDAYMRWDYNQLKEKVNIENTNNANKESTTGPVTGNGNPSSNFFTRDQVKAMSRDEVKSNYDSIMESMKSWK